MVNRRGFLKTVGLVSATAVLGGLDTAFAMNTGKDTWYMPDEGEPHHRTWMAFGASNNIWGKHLTPEVQRNLANIALTIAKYEPVSMLVRQSDFAIAKQLMGSKVELVVCPLDDLWMRDMGPVFVVTEDGEKKTIDFNFNGWGEKQKFHNDAKVARFVADFIGTNHTISKLILEGGGIEVDGQGTAIITESCILNDNSNPAVSKAECEKELKHLLGLEKIIWLPGIKGKDITDGHTDFYARFTTPGVVVAAYDPDPQSFDHAVTKRHLEILRTAIDAYGRKLDVVVLEAPSQIRDKYANDDFAAGYINFYVCNGAVIAPEFGDKKADADAKQKLTQLFPNREIILLNIDGIAAGGGGIHCTTQQEPRV
ncbi:MAG: agmatine deiminase family protein [Desulfobacterales bacterium]|nr:agmatine deiminase family protein [Desulfobacterales bacterium]